MTSDISSTIIRSWRERPPSSYSIKVENLSQLQSSTICSNGYYKFCRFSSGDYKWRMVVYPKGNDKDNGSGFISMYVEIDTTSLTSASQPEVYADIRFFIFNKKQDKYFTVQDVEPKPFNTLRKISGLAQVLPIDTFNDPKNGYIFDGDHCEFGVDIIVVPPPTKLEIMSFDEKLPNPKFSWTVKHFVDIKEKLHESKLHESDSFSMGGRKWFLMMYHKGFSSPYGKWLSVFLYLANGEILKEDEKIYVQALMKIEDPFGSNHVTYNVDHWYDNSGSGYGHRRFVSIAELQKSYLDKDGTLIVEIDFKVVSATKYSSFA